MDVLGIDIGGSGIKAAPVDVTTGNLTADRVKELIAELHAQKQSNHPT